MSWRNEWKREARGEKRERGGGRKKKRRKEAQLARKRCGVARKEKSRVDGRG
jgi:hypothetical protein